MGALVSLCQILQSALAQRITTHSGRTQAFAEDAAARASNTAPRASFNSFITHLRSGPRFPLFVVASGRLVQCRICKRKAVLAIPTIRHRPGYSCRTGTTTHGPATFSLI